MDERLKFVAAYLRGLDSLSELCRQHGISRKTGHKWVARYLDGGVAELDDHSRRPAARPSAVPDSVVALVVAARRAHPTWGPKKLHVAVGRDYPGLALPSTSTICRILRRHGLAEGRRRRRGKTEPYTSPFLGYDAPNDVWCADFKGHFALGRSGARCHPATITDGCSRYLLRCTALARPREAPTREVFDSAFREYGLPLAIRTDNGTPFASGGPGGLSRLSVWWIKLGITPERIPVGRPDQNGRHERMHRTLKAEATRPPRRTLPAQQAVFDAFRREYNQERPHEALGQRTPASVYTSSPRTYAGAAPPDPVYGDGIESRRVNAAGRLMWRGGDWYLGTALCHELVGLEAVEPNPGRPGCWRVSFGPLGLGAVVKGADRIQPTARDVVPEVAGELVGPTDDVDLDDDYENGDDA